MGRMSSQLHGARKQFGQHFASVLNREYVRVRSTEASSKEQGQGAASWLREQILKLGTSGSGSALNRDRTSHRLRDFQLEVFDRCIAGTRAFGIEMAHRVCDVLRLEADEEQLFLKLHAAARGEKGGRLGDPAPIVVLPVNFPPLCEPSFGSDDSRPFVNRLLWRMFGLADRQCQAPVQSCGNMEDRRQEVEDDGTASLLVDLVSLPRLRYLGFLETPIRVSLNGVATGFDHSDPEFEVVQRLVAGCPRNSDQPPVCDLYVVETDVGESQMKRVFSDHPGQRIEATVLDSSPTNILAQKLSCSERGLLVCDEITALGVMRAIRASGQRAELLFPLATNASVAALDTRRRLPAFVLGIGAARSAKRAELTCSPKVDPLIM
jgi:hypothetical protein